MCFLFSFESHARVWFCRGQCRRLPRTKETLGYLGNSTIRTPTRPAIPHLPARFNHYRVSSVAVLKNRRILLWRLFAVQYVDLIFWLILANFSFKLSTFHRCHTKQFEWCFAHYPSDMDHRQDFLRRDKGTWVTLRLVTTWLGVRVRASSEKTQPWLVQSTHSIVGLHWLLMMILTRKWSMQVHDGARVVFILFGRVWRRFHCEAPSHYFVQNCVWSSETVDWRVFHCFMWPWMAGHRVGTWLCSTTQRGKQCTVK